ncbi:hypothetical protein BC835DRAFT_275193 [Cytidiella melzeri]|nr:hypothetical protein BC835DRAFT_275193 [Cytidiella melzeri]
MSSTSNTAEGERQPKVTAFTLRDKLTAAALFMLTPLFITTMFSFACVMLATRGLAFAIIAFAVRDLVMGSEPSLAAFASSFIQGYMSVSLVSVLGSGLLGATIGVIFSIVYLVNGNVPNGVRALAPMNLPYITPGKGQSFQYRGDSIPVVCAGIIVGSVSVPLGYAAIRCFGWKLDQVVEDPTRPVLIGILGAFLGTALEHRRERAARAKEAKEKEMVAQTTMEEGAGEVGKSELSDEKHEMV